MVAMKGQGLLMVYTDVPGGHEDEFNRWYNEEHIPERLSIPGVLSAARYVAVRGGPKYLACYELAEAEAWHSDAWQDWLKNPTPGRSGCRLASLESTTSATCTVSFIPIMFPRKRQRPAWLQSCC